MAVGVRPTCRHRPRSATVAGGLPRCWRWVCFGRSRDRRVKLSMMLAAGVVAFGVRKPHMITTPGSQAGRRGRVVGPVEYQGGCSDLGRWSAPGDHPGLVDLLGRYGARATFFLIGVRASRHEDLVRQIVAGGHELGNHLLSDYPSILLAAAEFQALDEVVQSGCDLSVEPASGELHHQPVNRA